MDSKRLKEAYERLEALDERLTYKVRPRPGAMMSPTADQVDDKLKDLANYTVELKDILRDFMLAFARRRKKPEEWGLSPVGALQARLRPADSAGRRHSGNFFRGR